MNYFETYLIQHWDSAKRLPSSCDLDLIFKITGAVCDCQKGYVIDKPWLLSRFWVYCKLYHSLVTFHCLTPNEAESGLVQTVKGHLIII